MTTARTAASTVGRVVLLASLLCLVLVLAAFIAGPALAFAIFAAVLIPSPSVANLRAPAAVPATPRRRRFSPRAPPRS